MSYVSSPDETIAKHLKEHFYKKLDQFFENEKNYSVKKLLKLRDENKRIRCVIKIEQFLNKLEKYFSDNFYSNPVFFTEDYTLCNQNEDFQSALLEAKCKLFFTIENSVIELKKQVHKITQLKVNNYLN